MQQPSARPPAAPPFKRDLSASAAAGPEVPKKQRRTRAQTEAATAKVDAIADMLAALPDDDARRAIAPATARLLEADEHQAFLDRVLAADEPAGAALAPPPAGPPPAPVLDAVQQLELRLAPAMKMVLDLGKEVNTLVGDLPPPPASVTLAPSRVEAWITCCKTNDVARVADGGVAYRAGDEHGHGAGSRPSWMATSSLT